MKKKLYGIGLIGALLVSGALLGNKQEMLRRIEKNIIGQLEIATNQPDFYEYDEIAGIVGNAIDKIQPLNVPGGDAAKERIIEALKKFAAQKGGLVEGFVVEGTEFREKIPQVEGVEWEKMLEKLKEEPQFLEPKEEEFPEPVIEKPEIKGIEWRDVIEEKELPEGYMP